MGFPVVMCVIASHTGGVQSSQPTGDSRKGDGSSSHSGVAGWFKLAAHPATVRRALMTAGIVGCVLIAINHGPAILAGKVERARIFQMCLTFLVPYTVSTMSSVATRKELARKAKTPGN